jgi:hypothetical protein
LADISKSDRAVCLGRLGSAKTDDSEVSAAIERIGFRPEVAWDADGKLPQEAELYRLQLGNAQVLALVRNATKEAANQPPVTVRLPNVAHVYDVRAGEYLGHLASLKRALAPAEVAMYALLPYRVHGLECSVEATNEDVLVRVRVKADGQPTTHVFHVAVHDPGGAERPWYSANAIALGGQAEARVPLAFSDPRGQWTVYVKDVATGTKAAAVLSR